MSGALVLPILFLIMSVFAVLEATARTASLIGELQHPALRPGRSLLETIMWLLWWGVLDVAALLLAAMIMDTLSGRLTVTQVG
jgi:hypothetical protein